MRVKVYYTRSVAAHIATEINFVTKVIKEHP